MRHRLMAFIALLFAFVPASAQQGKFGKVFITTIVAEGQFPDPELDDSVKDMKKRAGDEFEVVESESEAKYLINVVERKTELRGKKFGGGTQSYKVVRATISVRDGDKWKPGTRLTNDGPNNGSSWGLAAGDVMERARKWVKEGGQ